MNENILVIDDEEDILSVIENYLAREEYRVRTASSGAEGIKLFMAEPSDLLIIDMRMPDIDGLEVMQQIRQIDEDAEFIILTGYPSIENAVQAMKEYRAYDYLTKPLTDVDSLYVTVDLALERRRLYREKKALVEKLKQRNNELQGEIEVRKRIEKALQRSKQDLCKKKEELETESKKLEETNITLRVLLRKGDEDKKELEEKVLHNVEKMIKPYLEQLKSNRLTEKQRIYADIIEKSLDEIISPFARKFSSGLLNLTPQELRLTDFIRQGKTSKEIAQLMNLSARTIESHRNSIRQKLGIKNKKTNLKTHLLSFEA
ncbi:MAG: response regulator [Desulfobacterales bacterium]|nr:response regulator [Desulfobacterales bacterium]